MQLRIKEILKEKKVTVVSLAESLGIAQPSMSNIVNNKTSPSLETIEKIARILGVTVSELLEEPRSGDYTCPHCGASLTVDINMVSPPKTIEHDYGQDEK